MIRTSRIYFAIALLLLTGCKPKETPAPKPEAASVLESIPAVDPDNYQHPRDLKDWQNPYLVIRTDGVGLLDLPNNELHMMKPDEVPDALAKLPTTAWPYGRVVAIAEARSADITQEERATIRKNRAIVAGTMKSMNVLIHWVPTL